MKRVPNLGGSAHCLLYTSTQRLNWGSTRIQDLFITHSQTDLVCGYCPSSASVLRYRANSEPTPPK